MVVPMQEESKVGMLEETQDGYRLRSRYSRSWSRHLKSRRSPHK